VQYAKKNGKVNELIIMIEKQKPCDVFISYATEDEAYAEKVANSLKSLGFKIWFAPATLKVGDSLLSSINAGLSASKYGFFCNQGKLHGTLKSNNTGKCRIPFINLILINVMPKREQFLITLNVLTMQYI
jgi:hypothetical protein